MPQKTQSGKLVVILHADIAGSTDLVRQDEHLAHDRMQSTFRRFSDHIAQYHGHVREVRGDALLAEFERASDAVSATLAFQANQAEYTTQLDDNILPMVRVGIAMGEVVIADNTVTGEGVVLAQRVEQLAEPGGLCITGAINEALPTRLPFDQKSLGEQNVKGFDETVRVYRVALKPGDVIPLPEKTQKPKATNALGISAAIATIILVIGGGVTFWIKPWLPEEEPASIERTAFPLPDKPSIAVLPFTNVSDDAEQEYFADGLTDDLITGLSKLSGLFVVSRNSVFTFKKQAIRVEEIAQQLGVRYVLVGTVRRASERVRVNAQLVNGSTGLHLWAERYDREMADIFGVQDELVTEIVKALAVQLTPEEQTQVGRAPTDNLQAYDLYLRARDIDFREVATQQREGVELFQRAIELDPRFAQAYAGLARLTVDVWRFDRLIVMNPVLARRMAEESATRALELDPAISQAHSVLALMRMVDGQHELATQLAQRAVELAPNSADALTTLAIVLVYGGAPERALEAMRTAVRLNPRPTAYMQSTYGWVLFMNRQYESAIALLEPIIYDRDVPFGDSSDTPFGDSPGETLVMAYARAGLTEKARSLRETQLRDYPYLNLSYFRVLYAHHARQSDLEHRLQALREAGVPEYGLGYTGNPADRVSDETLRGLVAAGRAWHGRDAARRDQPFVQEFMEQGSIVYATEGTIASGTVTVRDGQVCMRYELIHFGRYGCGYVYHNADGTTDAQNEYVYVAPALMLVFSTAR